MPKVHSAMETINKLNPDVNVVPFHGRLNVENIRDIIRDYDVVLDGSDNFPTRFLMNDAAYFEQKPLVSGSMFRFDGQVSVFNPRRGFPCYRCLYPEPPPKGLVPSCQEAGVLGALAGVIGVLQAVETVKLLLGIGDTLEGHLMIFDALKMTFRKVKVRKDPECGLCGDKATIRELVAYEEQACELRTAATCEK